MKYRNGSSGPYWLWWGSVSLLVTTLLVGLGLVAALAMGWRAPTPRRAPDWTADGASMWQVQGDGTLTFTPAGYQWCLSAPEQHAWAIAGQPVADFDLVMVARSSLDSEDIGYGVLYRYQDRDNHYLFAVGADGYYTVALVRGGRLTPVHDWQEWPHVRRGAGANRLRIRCQGATCRFYINGEFTAEITDRTFLSGDIGLWVETFSDPALAVTFEQVRLWLLTASDTDE